MNNEYTLKFTKNEIIVLFNSLLVNPDGKAREYPVLVGAILHGVIEKIKPFAAQDSNIEGSGMPSSNTGPMKPNSNHLVKEPINRPSTPSLDLGAEPKDKEVN